MKTDSIFYELFLNLPESLFPFLDLPPNLCEEYEFLSQELKQLAKRIDGVFVPIKSELPLYFVEVQFQKDDNLYYRLFTEIFTYLGQYKPPQDFQAIVFWSPKSLDIPLPVYYQSFQQSGKLTIIYLDEWNFDDNQGLAMGIVKLIVSPETEAITQVDGLFSLAETSFDSPTKKKDIIELLEKILVYKFSNYSREELDKMFTLTDFKKTRFYQETFSEGKEAGKIEGKVEGKIEGKLETIPDLIQLGLTVEKIASILKLDLELVKKVTQSS